MKFKKSTLVELGKILKEEFGFEPTPKELAELAYSLVGYFDLLSKINLRPEVRK